jgi:hypothetical protein
MGGDTSLVNKYRFPYSRGGREGSCLLFHETRRIDEKMATTRCDCVRWMESDLPDSCTGRIEESSHPHWNMSRVTWDSGWYALDLNCFIFNSCLTCWTLKDFERHIWENTVISILDYVEFFRHKLTRACEIELDNLKQSQDKMK